MNISGAILVGGKGRRFGGDKSLILLNGESLLEVVVRRFYDLFTEILLVGREGIKMEEKNIKCVVDIYNSSGSIGGIYTALNYCRDTHCFITACDMPFIKKEFVNFLLSFVEKEDKLDIVIPYSKNGFEPLCAVYSKRCIPIFDRLIKEGERKIIKALDFVKSRVISKDEIPNFREEMFFNINTIQDLKRAEQIAVLYKGG